MFAAFVYNMSQLKTHTVSLDLYILVCSCQYIIFQGLEKFAQLVFLSLQANAVYDAEHAESIQKGQHIQPSANGFLLAPGKFYLFTKIPCEENFT